MRSTNEVANKTWSRRAQILQRGQEVSEAGGSRSKWRVVRVAIVALQDMVYIGRMFFGDADTGDVVWDCDVRPSDGELRQPKQCCVDAY
jgi:hypothetical protein